MTEWIVECVLVVGRGGIATLLKTLENTNAVLLTFAACIIELIRTLIVTLSRNHAKSMTRFRGLAG